MSVTTDFGTPFAAILEDALEGKTPVASPKEKGTFKPRVENNCINWSHELFGSLVVDAGAGLTMYEYGATNSHAVMIGCGGKPSMKLTSEAFLRNGVKLLHVKGQDVTDISDRRISDLTVKIERVGEKAIHTRKKDEDNFDLIFLGGDGRFVQLQVSVTTRNGIFWVNVQELFAGQVVRTTRQKAKEFNILTHSVGGFEAFLAPLYARNAYPGADYMKTYGKIGPQLIDIAVSHRAIVPASESVIASWEPDWSFEPVKGYQKAVVNWFNAVTGYGVATLEDGQSCFMHFRAFFDEQGAPFMSRGRFPAPEPMSTLSLKCKFGEKGLQATAVRIS